MYAVRRRPRVLTAQSRPLKTINVHDHLRSKLCDLYENDCIFDKFECTFSGNGECVARAHRAALTGRHVLTGSYNNYFHIYDREASTDVVLQADKSAFKAKKTGGVKGAKGLGGKNAAKGVNGKTPIDVDSIDFNKKILHGAAVLSGTPLIAQPRTTRGRTSSPSPQPTTCVHPGSACSDVQLFLYSQQGSQTPA